MSKKRRSTQAVGTPGAQSDAPFGSPLGQSPTPHGRPSPPASARHHPHPPATNDHPGLCASAQPTVPAPRIAANNARGTAASASWNVTALAWRTTLAPILARDDPSAVSVVCACLGYQRRCRSAAALGAIKDPGAVPALLDFLEDGDAAVRRAAVEALAMRAGQRDSSTAFTGCQWYRALARSSSSDRRGPGGRCHQEDESIEDRCAPSLRRNRVRLRPDSPMETR